MSVLAGALAPPKRLRIGAHNFVADKSDNYEICDGAPQHREGAVALGRPPEDAR
jgi:hypothetical protein